MKQETKDKLNELADMWDRDAEEYREAGADPLTLMAVRTCAEELRHLADTGELLEEDR